MDLLLTPIWHNSCGSSLVNKQVAYGYDEDFLTHQPRVVFDTITSLPYNLYWDLNGNLTEVSNCKLGSARFHDWDEENRLHAVAGPSYAGFYGYDGNGNRVWKLTGSCSCSSQNGDDMVYSVTVDDGVIYPNPYITITPQGYTKHYYVGQERFATALGLGGWDIEPVAQNAREVDMSHDWFGHFEEYYPFGEITSSTTNNLGRTGDAPVELQYECNSPMQLYSLHVLWDYDMFNTCIYSYLGSPYAPDEIFFIHPDHLGSASWITNKYAEPEQYIHYAPYGELLANQQVNTYDERYKFTGKERDAESGYDYFGARFLAQQLGIWTTPDPLLDKYIFASPYMYCNGNPIKYVDPNGAFFDEANEKIAESIEKYVNNLLKNSCNLLKRIELRKSLRDIRSMRSDKTKEYLFIQNNSENAKEYGIEEGESSTKSLNNQGNKIGIFADFNSLSVGIADETIAHEVRHGGQIARGKLNADFSNYDYKHEKDAYRAQWGWSETGIINIPTKNHPQGEKISEPYQINNRFIESIIDPSGENVYIFNKNGK